MGSQSRLTLATMRIKHLLLVALIGLAFIALAESQPVPNNDEDENTDMVESVADEVDDEATEVETRRRGRPADATEVETRRQGRSVDVNDEIETRAKRSPIKKKKKKKGKKMKGKEGKGKKGGAWGKWKSKWKKKSSK